MRPILQHLPCVGGRHAAGTHPGRYRLRRNIGPLVAIIRSCKSASAAPGLRPTASMSLCYPTAIWAISAASSQGTRKDTLAFPKSRVVFVDAEWDCWTQNKMADLTAPIRGVFG